MARRILMISSTPSHPHDIGNRARIYSLLANLRRLGHAVSFLHINGPQKGDDDAMRRCWGEGFYSFPYTRPDRRWKIWLRRLRSLVQPGQRYLCGVDELYDSKLDGFLREIGADQAFDTVIVEYIFQSKALDAFGDDVFKLIDTHDVFTDRHLMYLRRQERPEWHSTTAAEEAKALSRADTVIAIQDHERRHFAGLVSKPVVTVGHVVPVHEPDWSPVVANQLLFVASNSLANRDALIFMLEDVLPRVREAVPTAALALAGALCEHVKDSPGLVKLGVLPDLRPAYAAAAAVVNPMLIGTGLKIKTIEALGHAKALVTTSVGAEGLEDGAGKAFLVAEGADDFATAVVDILRDQSRAEALAQSAANFALQKNHCTLQELEAVMA